MTPAPRSIPAAKQAAAPQAPEALRTASLAELRRVFATLPPPDAALRHGFFRARFIGPAWIRLSARPSLELTGLPGWQGKKFLTPETATNVLMQRKGPVDALAMAVTPGISAVDGKPGLALTYPPQDGRPAPFPWRLVRDEMRVLDDHTLLCMTIVDLPLLRHVAFPFLLTREA